MTPIPTQQQIEAFRTAFFDACDPPKLRLHAELVRAGLTAAMALQPDASAARAEAFEEAADIADHISDQLQEDGNRGNPHGYIKSAGADNVERMLRARAASERSAANQEAQPGASTEVPGTRLLAGRDLLAAAIRKTGVLGPHHPEAPATPDPSQSVDAREDLPSQIRSCLNKFEDCARHSLDSSWAWNDRCQALKHLEQAIAAALRAPDQSARLAELEAEVAQQREVKAALLATIDRRAAERDVAEAALAKAHTILKELEWNGGGNDEFCPVCGGWKSLGAPALARGQQPGHAQGCRLARALLFDAKPAPSLRSLLDQFYEREINVELSSVRDFGWVIGLFDRKVGSGGILSNQTLDQVEAWLKERLEERGT